MLGFFFHVCYMKRYHHCTPNYICIFFYRFDETKIFKHKFSINKSQNHQIFISFTYFLKYFRKCITCTNKWGYSRFDVIYDYKCRIIRCAQKHQNYWSFKTRTFIKSYLNEYKKISAIFVCKPNIVQEMDKLHFLQ